MKSFHTLAILCLSLVGCSKQISKDNAIKQIVEGGNSIRDEVISNPVFTNYKVYRDGKNDGVVYWYKTTNEYVAALKQDHEEGKANLVSDIRTAFAAEPGNPLERGIYLRYIYESLDGKTVEFFISSSDF